MNINTLIDIYTQTTFLTSDALAVRWFVSPNTLSQWRWNGKGPQFLKIGGRVLYRLHDVEAFEEQKCRQNTSRLFEQLDRH